MKTLTSDVTNALAGGLVPMALLVKMEFASGTIARNSGNLALTWGGTTYSAGGLGSISQVENSPGEIKGLSFEISGVAASDISLALDGADEWQGTPVTIYVALLDPTTYAVIDADIVWSGLGDTMSIQEDGETCTVSATAESSAVDFLRGVPITYTHADQQVLYPGDLAFQFVNDQSDKPIVWPSRDWFLR